MNKKILILFLILTSLIIPPIISAQESTDSSTTTSEEIEKIRKSVQEKVQEKLKDIVEIKTTKKAWIGTVSKIENTSITLENDNNKRVLICANNTVFIDLNRNKTSIDKLKEDQIVLAMGYSQDDQPNTLDTKRLIISQNNIDELRSSIILGKIADVSQSSPVFTLLSIKDKNTQFQVKYDSKKINQDELKTDQKIIAILKPDPKNNNNYTLLDYKILQKPTPTPTPTPTN